MPAAVGSTRRAAEDRSGAAALRRRAAGSLLLKVACCPVMEAILEGGAGPCQQVVLAQWEHGFPREEIARRWRAEHELPEPWSGDLTGAPILFVSSNPSGRPKRLGSWSDPARVPRPEDDAEHPSRRHGGSFPRPGWAEEEIRDYFHARFALTVAPGGYHRFPDGSRGRYQPFWGWADARVRSSCREGRSRAMPA